MNELHFKLQGEAPNQIIGEYADKYDEDVVSVVVPQDVTAIADNAFASSRYLKRVYIPSTVQTVGVDAFKDCPKLTIYLSGEQPEEWIDKVEVKYEKEYNDGYAFDFHRGGVTGGWVETVRKEIVTSFNPDKRPVKTNVKLEKFIKIGE